MEHGLIKAELSLPFDPTVPPQVSTQEKGALCPPEDRHRMFQAAVVIIASAWKQPKCPSAGEWVHQGVIVTYAAMTMNQRPPHAEHGCPVDMLLRPGRALIVKFLNR